MPTISTGDKVLVSGANGFLAIWAVRRLLEKSYTVRGTVRSADKGTYLEKYFQAYGDKIEVVVVEDITKEGAFDEAVKGVDAVLHMASPFYLSATSVDELVNPAVNGTVGILKSALKNGHGVKRVAVTSSCASVFEVGVDKVFNELDWNELAVREINEHGDAASGLSKYCASKTFAEKGELLFKIITAWEFYEQNKASIKWDLSALNPTFVYGPAIHEVKNLDALNASSRLWYDAVLGGGQTEAFLKVEGSTYIDVRDVAEAHILTLEQEAAGGERIIISAGPYVWQDWLDAANSLPSLHRKLTVGYPGAGAAAKPPVSYDTSKAARILGLKYHTKEEVAQAMLVDFEERGW
ncbi:hypothetical protein C0991_006438 [Blastosporella zonata]|nr:hypothetical protein C0991_006438 [Blastosporella zonata]